MRRALTMLAFTTFTALGTLPATAGGTTTISISIDCPGCKVSAVNAKSYYRSDGREDPYYRWANVRKGRAVLKVPTSKTRGMAFEVLDLTYGRPTVVLKRAGNRGSWCWAGTRAKNVTLGISTKRWVDTSAPEAAPEHYQMAAWATPSMKTYHDGRNMHRMRKGGLSNQNHPGCR